MRIVVNKFIFTLMIIGLCFSSKAQTPQTIVGQWKGVEKSDRQIEFVHEADGSFSGKVINDKSKEPKNGRLILRNLKFESQSKSFKGKMTPPDKGIELDVKVSFEGNDKLEIIATKFFMTKKIHFLRIK